VDNSRDYRRDDIDGEGDGGDPQELAEVLTVERYGRIYDLAQVSGLS
jgi:hypothetical protein